MTSRRSFNALDLIDSASKEPTSRPPFVGDIVEKNNPVC